MSDARLHFYPWMRRGLAAAIAAPADDRGRPVAPAARITARVVLRAGGSDAGEATRTVAVRGPGDVVGLAPGMIARTTPPPRTTDFETNYFPAVELTAPDLPWMFTPAAPRSGAGAVSRLQPWVVLVVVADRDGVSLQSQAGAPLPVLSVPADAVAEELPDLADAWAWVHVQASADPGGDVQAAYAMQPEGFVARLLCPRRLDAGRWYTACLVPSFRAGRQAGLGLPAGEGSDDDSWPPAWDVANPSGTVELPVYHSWRFRTSTEAGDFESLVRRLQPEPLDPSVGVRAMDVGGAAPPGHPVIPRYPAGTVVAGYRGALTAPDPDVPRWTRPHRGEFRQGLADDLNASLSAGPAPRRYDPRRHDPVVGPPAYGTLPTGNAAVPAPADRPPSSRWLRAVNLDIPQRAVAGVGVDVVRRNQERLMAHAWDQAAGLREANRVLNRTRLALEVGKVMKARVDRFDDYTRLQISRGAHARLKAPGAARTVGGELAASAIPDGLVSAAFRARTRPGATIQRATPPSRPRATLTASITARYDDEPQRMLAVARWVVPAGLVLADADAPTVSKATERDFAVSAARSQSMLRVLDSPAATGPPRVQRRSAQPAAPRPLLSAEAQVAVRAAKSPPPDPAPQRATEESRARPAPHEELLTDLAAVVTAQLDPALVLAARVRAVVDAPCLDGDTAPDVPAGCRFVPAFPDPLYDDVVAIDPELLMPGATEIPPDVVSLAVVNASFVEAFLVGANHELAREFVWREYPATLTDTWLRTFWDRGGAEGYDIAPIASWSSRPLGRHPEKPAAFDPADLLVLVVRSDLLRRYPDTLIYAVPAAVEPGTGVRAEDRSQGTAPWKWPVFSGALTDDLSFLGFDFRPPPGLTAVELARGAPPESGEPGWYFVFEQPPTQPRFGLDVGRPGQAGRPVRRPQVWADLSWYHQVGEGELADLSHVGVTRYDGITKRFDRSRGGVGGPNDAVRLTWGANAAHMAFITFQRPVRMLVHADQMLLDDGGG